MMDIPDDSDHVASEIERVHDQLTGEYAADDVYVGESNNGIVALIGEGVGAIVAETEQEFTDTVLTDVDGDDTQVQSAPEGIAQLTTTDEYVRLKTKINRGSGTRDEETHTIEVKKETMAEAVAAYLDLIEQFTDEIAPEIRRFDPQRDND